MKNIYSKKSILLLLVIMNLVAYNNRSYAQQHKRVFTILDSVIANPDRGLYYAYRFGGSWNELLVDRYSSNPSVKLIDYVKNNKGTIIHFGMVLKDFKHTYDISTGFLDSLEMIFNTLRSNGLKCTIIPFYDDLLGTYEPGIDTLLHHIGQLKQVLRKHQDVIIVQHYGYVGRWGEQGLSSNDQFGYIVPSTTSNPTPYTLDHFLMRKRILDSMLNTYTDGKIISVRAPIYKLNLFQKYYIDSLTATTAHTGTDYSRIGYHDDGFCGSWNDLGTWNANFRIFRNNSIGTTIPAIMSSTVNDMSRFVQGDSKYTSYGGEAGTTLEAEDNPYCECTASQNRMKSLHLSYLSATWSPKVIDSSWKKYGCFDTMVWSMGYRIVVDSIKYDTLVQKENTFNVKVYLTNRGYASTINRKRVVLGFRRIESNYLYQHYLPDFDTRKWYSGEQVVLDVTVPSLGKYGGTYDVYLNLTDYSDSLKDNRSYNVRFSSQDVWDVPRKMNKLSDKPIKLLWPGAMMNKEMEMASEKLLNDNEIYVYPNPTSDILSVSVSSQKQSDHNVVAIFNTNGKCVYTATYDFFSGNNVLQVNVSDFIAGTYIISVREPNNNNKERRLKFVKK